VVLGRPAAGFLAVQLLGGGLRFLVAVQIGEGESARAAGLLVGDDLHRADGPVLARDQLLDLRFRRVEGKITYEQASHVLVPFSSVSYSRSRRRAPEAALWHPALVMPEAVRLRGATKRYGAFTALDHVDLDIHRAEVFAL